MQVSGLHALTPLTALHALCMLAFEQLMWLESLTLILCCFFLRGGPVLSPKCGQGQHTSCALIRQGTRSNFQTCDVVLLTLRSKLYNCAISTGSSCPYASGQYLEGCLEERALLRVAHEQLHPTLWEDWNAAQGPRILLTTFECAEATRACPVRGGCHLSTC